MLVVVVLVRGVAVSVVDVVDVIAVLDGLVAARRAVLVLGDGVLCALLISHGVLLRWDVRLGRLLHPFSHSHARISTVGYMLVGV